MRYAAGAPILVMRRMPGFLSKVVMKKTFFSTLLCLAATLTVPSSFGQSITGMLGPNNPAIVDVYGQLTAAPDGAPATPSRTGTFLFLDHPWSTSPATGQLCSYDAVTGKYMGICRTSPNGLVQSLTINGFTTGGYPSSFQFMQTGGASPVTGTGTLVDQNGDGIWDGIALSGGSVNVTLPFVYVDTNGDGYADYISIPWSQATLIGINPNGSVLLQAAGGPNPQIWVPLADTNGDGKPDAIVLDLTGSGTPDPDLFPSPKMGPVVAPATLAPPVPTLTEWGVFGMVLALMVVGLWQLRIHAS